MLSGSYPSATAHKVVSLSHLGQQEEAKKSVKKLINENPEFSINFARENLFYLKKPEQIELYLDGLRKAGIPE